MINKNEREKMKQNPWQFIQTLNTLNIASINNDNSPQLSYAPFIENEQKLYICISGMAKHTKNLLRTRTASVMIIEDESQSNNLFARKRVTFDVTATPIERNSALFNEAMILFRNKFGDQAAIYENMADFQLFKLSPQSGRAVFGFGEAYDFKDGIFSTKAAGMVR